jgi:AbiU2
LSVLELQMLSPAYKSYIDELRHTVTVAGLNYEIWWTYKSKDTRPQFIDVMNRYSIFFQTSIHAHFVALLVSLYRLYETRTDTYNIPRFIELLETDTTLSPDVIQSLRSKYELAKPVWIKVNILRNKVFGHRSLARTVEEAFAEAGVKPDELKAMMDVTKSLLNELTNELERSTHAFNLGAGGEVLRLLTDLRK